MRWTHGIPAVARNATIFGAGPGGAARRSGGPVPSSGQRTRRISPSTSWMPVMWPLRYAVVDSRTRRQSRFALDDGRGSVRYDPMRHARLNAGPRVADDLPDDDLPPLRDTSDSDPVGFAMRPGGASLAQPTNAAANSMLPVLR
jgi:hypothetical protein